MPAPNPLETYLRELRDGRAIGVAETSFYPTLANLLNTIGATLKPKVRCIMHPRNLGAGLPDGGLYTPDQLAHSADGTSIAAQVPARGAVEVKPIADAVEQVAASPQVAKYLARYSQVLVTNYRDFLLLGRDATGQTHALERYSLAPTEAAFWAALADPHALAEEHAERLAEYLRRVMLSRATLADPRDVAWFLASYARDARIRVERAALPALAPVRSALEQALGIDFQGDRGDHFFRSTLVQTLFYGMFSAWVLWCKDHPGPTERFDWRTALYYLHVPMIESLFHQVAQPMHLRSLNLIEVLDWTAAALNRVDRAVFFERFEEGHAVQYFYEPFLEAFDPELRKDLGVWYTPNEIVRYQVARVDTVLRTELGIADGLADPRVVVLDPCCGTGAYLVEVLRQIATTLRAQGGDALLADDLKRAACERVFGFELLPAPFVVAHLQLGLLLRTLGAPLAEEGERVGVYLTNALTGWEPPDAQKERMVQLQLAGIPGLQEERDLARQVKREARILVILGNPPYSGYAGVAIGEERDLSAAYRTTVRASKPQGQGLNDLYTRFFRMAERRIVEQTGQGVICFISNYSWLDGLSFTGMRERYLSTFDRIWIDSLNGDKYKTGKLTPEGQPDPSVFSTPFNPEGIQVGTAIALLVRRPDHGTDAFPSPGPGRGGQGVRALHFRHFWGKHKRAALVEAAARDEQTDYVLLNPPLEIGLPFMPTQVEASYTSWPLLPALFPVSFPGIQSGRDDVLVNIEQNRLEAKIKQYFNPAISHEELGRIIPGVMQNSARFQATSTRDYLLKRGYRPEGIVRFFYRPFDIRWLYWEPETKLLDEKRADYVEQISKDNIWLSAVAQNRKSYDPPLVSIRHSSRHIIERGANLFPLYLTTQEQRSLFDEPSDDRLRPNLSDAASAYLQRIGAEAPELFYHAIACLHAPAYRAENAGALRQDWPRVPLPASAATLRTSAALGRQLAALLDPETAVAGVTGGVVRAELRAIGVITRVGGGALQPTAGELDLTAGWGHAGQGGVTMPGKGRAIAREYTADERAALESLPGAPTLLGASTYDIHLNGVAYWKNIPAAVWEYTIGGYQVIKKWLSYREKPLLGRALTADEVREVTAIARRIAAILLLAPALDASYQAVKADSIDWKTLAKNKKS